MPKPNLKVTDWFPVSTAPALPGYYEVGCDNGAEISPMRRWWDGTRWLNAEGGNCSSLFMRDRTDAVWRGVRMWVLIRTPHPLGVPVYCIDPAAELPGWSRLATDATPYKTRAAAMRAVARFPHLGLKAVLA